MKIVVDLNIIISALIKKSLSRDIIFKPFLEFYFPETAFYKILKYKSYIIEKSKISDNSFFILIIRLFSYITLISRNRLLEYREQAKRIMDNIDEDDTLFIAAAMSLGEEAVIWSDDKDFEKQKEIKVLKTMEIINYLNNKNEKK